jgi:hypothetical protein
MATEHSTDTELDTGTDTEETSLRDDLDAAFEEHATEDPPASGTRPRDAGGRFASTKAETAGNVPTDPAPAATSTTQGVAAALSGAAQGQQVAATGNLQVQQQPELKAPQSWTPAAREKWASVDPDIKAEIHRRESEAGRVIQSAAAQRQFVDAFERLMQPYEMFIRAENSNPLDAVDNMMRTAAQLRVGTPAAKVEIVAGIIKNFGIDLPALDAVLAGQQMPQNFGQPQQFRDPRVDQLLAMQQQQRQQEAQFEQQSITHGLAQFAQGHEFYGDVAPLMADILEVQTKQGIPIDLEKIYARACQLHDGVSSILQQRAAAQQTSSSRQAVLRAKRAASSVKGDGAPTGRTMPKGDSIRDAIEAAFDAGDAA